MLIDRRGWLWIGTDSGLSVFDGIRFVSADSSNGLKSNDMDQGGLFEDADGTVWLGTSQGISHLLHPEQLFSPQVLQPVISSVQLGSIAFPPQIAAFSRKPLTIEFVFLTSDWINSFGSAIGWMTLMKDGRIPRAVLRGTPRFHQDDIGLL